MDKSVKESRLEINKLLNECRKDLREVINTLTKLGVLKYTNNLLDLDMEILRIKMRIIHEINMLEKI
jgi:hypothetical protein